MPFQKTIAYIKHADAGIAAYGGTNVAPYMADTSMKLMQYGILGLPSVCPQVVVGDRLGRFGYEPGSRSSILAAINSALAAGRFPGFAALTWAEVVDRILEPFRYPDTRIDSQA